MMIKCGFSLLTFLLTFYVVNILPLPISLKKKKKMFIVMTFDFSLREVP